MSTQTAAIHEPTPAKASDFHAAFIVAWAFCLLFYFHGVRRTLRAERDAT